MIWKKLVYFANTVLLYFNLIIIIIVYFNNKIIFSFLIKLKNLTISYHTLPMILPLKHIKPSKVKLTILHSTQRKPSNYDLVTVEIASKLRKKTQLLLTYLYNSMLKLLDFLILWKYYGNT